MISVDDALKEILVRAQPIGAERVHIGAARGRILSHGVAARIDNPAFDVSAMDGYAFRSQDVAAGGTLEQIGASQAGKAFAGSIGKGQCVRIFTGAPVPEGADAVIMQEEASADGNRISFNQQPRQRQNIRFRGEDFISGKELVAAGTELTAHRIGLIAAGNVAEVDVALQPRVAIVATGDELVVPGNPVGPDQIVASNSVALSALLSPFSASITDLGIVRDQTSALSATLQQALSQEPDVLVTTGGASVGEHDLVQDVLKASGVTIDFWRIAMRPGKPLMFGTHGKTLVFGLPGNPVSALVTARLFVVPALLAIAGGTPQRPLSLPLAAPLSPNGPRRHYLRGRLILDSEGHTAVEPLPQTDSGHLSSLAAADVLVVQKENCGGRDVGDHIETIVI